MVAKPIVAKSRLVAKPIVAKSNEDRICLEGIEESKTTLLKDTPVVLKTFINAKQNNGKLEDIYNC